MWSFYLKFKEQLSKAQLISLIKGLIKLGYFDETVIFTDSNQYKQQTIADIEKDLLNNETSTVFIHGLDGGKLRPKHKLYDVLTEIDNTSLKWFDCNQSIYSVNLRNDRIGFSLDGSADIGMAKEAIELPNFAKFIFEINNLTDNQLINEVFEDFY